MQYNEKESYYIELNPARFAVTTIGKVLVLIPLPIMPTINEIKIPMLTHEDFNGLN